MHKVTISAALVGVSLILLVAERVQEIVFEGAAAIAMSIVAFVVSRKVPSKTISLLLFVNGGIIIRGEIITILQAKFSSEDIGAVKGLKTCLIVVAPFLLLLSES